MSKRNKKDYLFDFVDIQINPERTEPICSIIMPIGRDTKQRIIREGNEIANQMLNKIK